MALKSCPDCDRQVSESAELCPHCGLVSPVPSHNNGSSDEPKRYISEWYKSLIWVMLAVLVIIAICFSVNFWLPVILIILFFIIFWRLITTMVIFAAIAYVVVHLAIYFITGG